MKKKKDERTAPHQLKSSAPAVPAKEVIKAEDQVVKSNNPSKGSEKPAPAYVPSDNTQKYLRSQRRNWARITGIISTFALVIIFAQAVIYYFTLREVSRSANIAQQDQRPYVWLTNNLGKPGCIRAPNAPDVPDCYVVWDYHFTNYGKTPANNVRFVGNLNVGDNADKKPQVLEPLRAAAPIPPNKDDFATALWQTKISEQEFGRLMKSEDTIVLFGRVLYTDAYGRNYETGFCLQHLASGAIAYCGGSEGNYIK